MTEEKEKVFNDSDWDFYLIIVEYKSSNIGFVLAISSSFFSLDQLFICFSLSIAVIESLYIS